MGFDTYFLNEKISCILISSLPSMLLFCVVSQVQLLVSPLDREVAGVELRDRPQTGQAHES